MGLIERIGAELSGALGLPPQNAHIMAGNMIRLARSQPGDETFVRAANMFGKFDRAFLLHLRQTVLASRDTDADTRPEARLAPTPAAGSAPRQLELDNAQPLRAGLQTLGGEVRLHTQLHIIWPPRPSRVPCTSGLAGWLRRPTTWLYDSLTD